MAEIIPTILVKNFKEVEERIKAVEKYVSWVQLDIMDGIFVSNTTWHNPEDLKKIKTAIKLEVHLMVEKPEEVIEDWLKSVDRIIFHFESRISDLAGLIKKIHNRGKQVGLAINPETHLSVVEPFLQDLDSVLFMTVQPGQGGQEFKNWVLDKVRALRDMWPDGNIEIDGGMNSETAKRAIEAGANLVCAGSYIFKSKNINKAINELKSCTTS